jgi:rubrerythrin
MLKLALNAATSQHDFLLRLAENAKMTEVKTLLYKLAQSESQAVEKITHMMATGIVDELEELSNDDPNSLPDTTPISPSRNDLDPRIFVCNQVLEKSIKTYTLYLRLATRCKSDIVSQLFEYLANEEKHQIAELRSICSKF